jgi:hypothetical protein
MHGVNNPHAKLIQEEVDGIREFYTQGITLTKLSRIFNIAVSQVSEIVNYQSWRKEVNG